jgi:hypothetical protein
MIYFNGFNLLCCILSAVLGAVFALRTAKLMRDYEIVRRPATVWESMVRDHGNPLEVNDDDF